MPAPGGRPSPSTDRPPPTGNGGKKGGRGRPSPSTDNDFLAQLIAQNAATSAQNVNSNITAQASANRFDPAALLAAQKGLDDAYREPWRPEEDEPTSRDDLNKYVLDQSFRSAGIDLGSAGSVSADIANAPRVQKAEAEYQDQLRSRRADALNVKAVGENEAVDLVNNKEIKGKTKQLSWDEYNSLTPLQKAAIDYNTMLVKAVKTDNRNREQYVDTDSQQYKTYTEAFERMFPGQNVASAKYSPETMAVLRQIGYEGDSEGNLNDFLNLNTAIKTKDLKTLNGPAGAPDLRRGGASFANPVKEERSNFLGGLAQGTQQATAEALGKGNEILARFSTQAMAQARAADSERLGGIGAPTGLGGLNDKMEEGFAQAFDLLADKNMDSQQVLYALQNEWSEDERKKFVSYAQKRMVAAESEGRALTDTEGLTPRSAVELAGILKIRGFKPRPGTEGY